MSKTDNSVKVQIISTIGLIIVALITILVPRLFNDKPSLPNKEVLEDSIQIQYSKRVDMSESPKEINDQPISKITGSVYFESGGVTQAKVNISGYGYVFTDENGDFSIILDKPLKSTGENLIVNFSHPNFGKKTLNRTFYGEHINLYFE